MRAETGVGPSIASGNQVWSNIWADFPIAPINKSKQIKSIAFNSIPKKIRFFSAIVGINSKTSE